MSQNRQPPRPLSLAGRIDPGHVRQLEQQAQLQSTLLVQRALSDISNLANALHHLTEQATAGNAAARTTLQLMFDNWERARAAAAGIITAGTPPPATG